MGQGLQVFRADSSLKFDASKRVGRIVGTVVTTGGSSGTIKNAAFLTGTPFAVFTPATLDRRGTDLVWSFTGDTFSWSKNGAANATSGYLVVGVF